MIAPLSQKAISGAFRTRLREKISPLVRASRETTLLSWLVFKPVEAQKPRSHTEKKYEIENKAFNTRHNVPFEMITAFPALDAPRETNLF